MRAGEQMRASTVDVNFKSAPGEGAQGYLTRLTARRPTLTQGALSFTERCIYHHHLAIGSLCVQPCSDETAVYSCSRSSSFSIAVL